MQTPRVTLLDQPPRWERILKKASNVLGKAVAALVTAVLAGTGVAVVLLVCAKILIKAWTWVF